MQPTAPATPTTPAPQPVTTSAQALTNLQQFQGGMQKPQDIQAQQEQQYGVPAAQQNVSGLRQAITNTTNLLNQIPSSVYGRTGGSLVTNAQATRQIAGEQAPISQQLTKQGEAFTGAQGDLATALKQAETGTQLGVAGQTAQGTGLQDVYNALYKQEQDARANQLAQQDLQLRQKQANSGINLASLLGLTTTPTAPTAFMQPKNPQNPAAGFAFTDNTGRPISAGAYAQTTNTPIGQVLQSMGAAGDKYAQQAYNQIKSQMDYYNANPDILKKEFAPLFWGL